jgi:hypothetical protein
MRIGWKAILVGACASACALGFAIGQATARTKADATVVRAYGVGGILTESGSLWQYMPDQKRWMTIDEAFKESGKETKVLPLPVAPKDIRFMESWGFLVTVDGKIWHYDLEDMAWHNIGTP